MLQGGIAAHDTHASFTQVAVLGVPSGLWWFGQGYAIGSLPP
jgi:hypothetical protein